jgi:hypothetical protein
MATVGNFPDLASAQLAQSVLREHGVVTLIPDEYLAGVDWQLGTALQGVRLQVRTSDLERASSILAASHGPEFDDEEESAEDEDEPEACPRCQSTLVGPPPWKRRLKVATFLFPPLIFLWPLFALRGVDRTCSSCGLSWNHEASRGSVDPS